MTEILAVRSTWIEVELLRHMQDGNWPKQPEIFSVGDRLTLTSIGLSVLLDAFYETRRCGRSGRGGDCESCPNRPLAEHAKTPVRETFREGISMSQLAPTVKYQLIWRELFVLAENVKNKSREDKDIALREFARHHTKYITIGQAHDGQIKIHFHRNMINYLRRNGEDVGRFKDIFLQSAQRRYGSASELRPSS